LIGFPRVTSPIVTRARLIKRGSSLRREIDEFRRDEFDEFDARARRAGCRITKQIRVKTPPPPPLEGNHRIVEVDLATASRNLVLALLSVHGLSILPISVHF